MTRPIGKLAVAAVTIVAVSILLSQLGDVLGSSPVAWADITEHFESVPFFHLTLYIGHETSPETQKIEIWKSEGSRLRAHEGNKVFFADFTRKDQQIVVFDGTTRKSVEGGGNAPGFLAMLCKDGQFSLNTLTASFPSGVKGITPVTTADTAASQETVLFEAKHETTPERLTIWALRESKLPIRMRFEDPRQQEFGDFFFDYSEKKALAFFDPNAFTQGQG
ncbi:MAG: hypothetical protein KBE65_01890 [Phycisphaerae bacterium]|nr:hypothetical protein [Phycisphaerae bacterium]